MSLVAICGVSNASIAAVFQERLVFDRHLEIIGNGELDVGWYSEKLLPSWFSLNASRVTKPDFGLVELHTTRSTNLIPYTQLNRVHAIRISHCKKISHRIFSILNQFPALRSVIVDKNLPGSPNDIFAADQHIELPKITGAKFSIQVVDEGLNLLREH